MSLKGGAFDVTVAIALLMGTMFLANIGFGVILPTLPFLSEHIGATPFELGLALACFAVAQLLSSTVWGTLSDRIGRKPVLIVGIVGYGVSSAALAFVPNVGLLLASRFVAGVMAAAVFPSTQALAADWTLPKDRARILGYMGSMNGIGFIVGPPIGSLLYTIAPQAPFVGVGALSLINGLLAVWLLPREAKRTVRAETTSVAPDGSEPRPSRFAVLVQSFKDLDIAPFLLGSLVFSVADACIASTLAYYITGHLHSTEAMAGFAFMINGAIGALVQITLLGRIHSRFGESATILTGFTLGSVGYFGLALSNAIYFAFGAIVFLACCRGFAFPSMSAAISVRSSRYRQGSSFGSQQTANSLGRTIGPIVAGWLFTWNERGPFLFSALLIATFVGLYMLWAHMGKRHAIADTTEDVIHMETR